MKKLLAIVFLMPLLSCSLDSDDPINSDILGNWMLVQTSGQIPNSTQTGADMPFQETYSINSNGTFQKVRITDGNVLKASGTFEISVPGEGHENDEIQSYVYFHHEFRSLLLATCFSNSLTEHLYLDNNGRLINTYDGCDGMGLEYEKSSIKK